MVETIVSVGGGSGYTQEIIVTDSTGAHSFAHTVGTESRSYPMLWLIGAAKQMGYDVNGTLELFSTALDMGSITSVAAKITSTVGGTIVLRGFTVERLTTP